MSHQKSQFTRQPACGSRDGGKVREAFWPLVHRASRCRVGQGPESALASAKAQAKLLLAKFGGSSRFICGFDFIGCLSTAEESHGAASGKPAACGVQDFVVSGTTSEQLFGVCESFWRPGRGSCCPSPEASAWLIGSGMNKDELFETLSQHLGRSHCEARAKMPPSRDLHTHCATTGICNRVLCCS